MKCTKLVKIHLSVELKHSPTHTHLLVFFFLSQIFFKHSTMILGELQLISKVTPVCDKKNDWLMCFLLVPVYEGQSKAWIFYAKKFIHLNSINFLVQWVSISFSPLLVTGFVFFFILETTIQNTVTGVILSQVLWKTLIWPNSSKLRNCLQISNIP